MLLILIKMKFASILLCFTILASAQCLIDFKNFQGHPMPTDFDGSPLFLTKLLEEGLISEARNLSSVKPLVGNVGSYSGFLTVNEYCNSNLFFWFFPSETFYKTAPVLVWLQGGPGASSMYGLFSEHGPYAIDKNLNVTLRKFSWTKTLSVLYIDNPVGTGYSFTDLKECYATNEIDVGINLYEAMRQFYLMFPELSKNELYIAGESYGGKYAPALAYAIHLANKMDVFKMNLTGISLGNGFSDPIHMLNYGDYLFEIGLVDRNGRDAFKEKSDEAANLIKNKEYLKAYKIFDSVLNNDEGNSSSLFTNLTGYTNYYNYLIPKDISFDYLSDFIQQDHIREAIHVGNLTYHVVALEVEQCLCEDMMQSMAPIIQVLIENYKLLVYNGQLDIIVAYPLTLEFLKNLKWSGAEEYKTAPRKVWKIKDEIAGYSKTVGNLNEVIVRNAGHMVPADQPLYAFDLINRFVFNKSFAFKN